MQWEYKIEEIGIRSFDDEQKSWKWLNDLGEDRWEAVAVWSEPVQRTFVLLKRQKPNI